MHDELIERRLRSALQDEAGRLPLTITAAELERRAVLRGRGGPRRLTLLLAAAVAIGAIGVGAAVGGLFDPPPNTSVAPTHPAEPSDSPRPTATFPRIGPAPRVLPDLDEMLADVVPAAVVVANSHGAADGSAALPAGMEGRVVHVILTTLQPDTDYEIRYACLGAPDISFDLDAVEAGSGNLQGSQCDWASSVVPVPAAPVARRLTMRTSLPGSWRIVVVRLSGVAPAPLPEAPNLVTPDHEAELLRSELVTPTVGGSAGPPQGGLALNALEGVPPRNSYRVELWCEGGAAVRYLHATRTSTAFIVGSATQVPCDGNVHSVALGFPEPEGTEAYVAATPGSRVAVLLTSPMPPIAQVQEEPGWTLSSGFGPAFSFDTEQHSFTGVADQNGEGRARVALSCAGVGRVEVGVELHAPMGDGERDETFTVECGAGPSTIAMTFEGTEGYVTVVWTSLPEQWTAISILTPEPPG